MNLSEQERNMGLVVTVCKCCGDVYKTHGMNNSTCFSLIPGYGCSKCLGRVDIAAEQRILSDSRSDDRAHGQAAMREL